MGLRRWIRRRRAVRSRRILDILDRIAKYDAPGNNGNEEEYYREQRRQWAQMEIDELDAVHPPVRVVRRTWTWWLRWAGVLVVCYVGGSWMAFQLRHPELTQTEAFLSFWDAMTWR